ncbi:MAG: DUF881 domain-containing protein [Micromonosporaceae bacterium]|jgi:uncharacterized protein YlxW (UPF0749 family)
MTRARPDRSTGVLPPLSPDFLTDLFRDPLDPGYAAAAAARDGRPVPRWRRIGARLMTLASLMVIGMMLAVSYLQVVRDAPARTQLRDELATQIEQRDATVRALEGRLEDLRDEVARVRERELAGPEARRLRDLEAAVGLAAVDGPGVVVEVSDGPEQLDPATGEPLVETRIQDYDLRMIANAMWSLGAEAVAINDRRLTSTSTIRNASGAILVNRLPVAPPYLVIAVGPDDLADRFLASRAARYLEALAGRYGISYEIRSEDHLSLPAAVSSDLRHATPAGSPTSGGDH